MDFSLFYLAFALFWKLSSGLRCFKCVPEAIYNTDTNMCNNFDGSEKYYVNCYNSSMCYKRETVMEFSEGVTARSFELGCAQQTLEGEQKRINGKWERTFDIHDAYEVGCKVDGEYPDRLTKTVHCYCRGDLCNSATSLEHISILFIFTVYFFQT